MQKTWSSGRYRPSGRWTRLPRACNIADLRDESPKSVWVNGLPVGEPAKASLGRLVDVDHDAAEESYYESAADPLFVQIEREQRRYREMFRRRLRHLKAGERNSRRSAG